MLDGKPGLTVDVQFIPTVMFQVELRALCQHFNFIFTMLLLVAVETTVVSLQGNSGSIVITQ